MHGSDQPLFWTDLLPSPSPPLLTNDDVTASDHLPVVMLFRCPDPPIEMSTNLENWFIKASNLTALAEQQTWTAPAGAATQFYRVIRSP